MNPDPARTDSPEAIRRLLEGPWGREGLVLSLDQQRQLERYLEILDRWNRKLNLTALEGESRIERLVAEPLWVAGRLRPAGRYLDVGSGNGSPGIPWHVLRHFERADLVEGRTRRAVFLEQAVRQLRLDDVYVHTGRIEGLLNLGPFDWITLQGLRLTEELYSRLAGLSAPGGRLVWLTSSREPAIRSLERVKIPGSQREAFVFAVGPDRNGPEAGGESGVPGD